MVVTKRKNTIADFPLVRYVPATETMLDSLAIGHDVYRGPAGRDQSWEESTLSDVYLESHNARCNFCLIDFEAPRRSSREPRQQPEKPAPEPLRQLPCDHVFHVSILNLCPSQIPKWINIAVCNRNHASMNGYLQNLNVFCVGGMFLRCHPLVQIVHPLQTQLVRVQEGDPLLQFSHRPAHR